MVKTNTDVIAIYSRKSKFTGKGESIGNQIELCRDYIRLNYGEDYAESAIVFEDEGFSGGNLERPDFKRMMKLAHQRKFKAIIVYRLDRISRNISDFAGLIQELDALDIAFVSIREQFDTNTPMGRAMMFIASVFSQLERETIAERIRDNMRELAKTGRWLGGMTPTGYTSESVTTVSVDGKQHKACKLKLLPEEAETVKLIFDLFLEHDSLTAVEAELLRRHITTRRGKEHTRFSIKGILQNPVYMIADETAYHYFKEREADLFADLSAFDGVRGIMAYNRTDQNKGKTTVYLPINEWIVSVGEHPGMIPSRTWIKVQESLDRNKSKGYRKPRSNVALLTGLLYCSCGNRMYPKQLKRTTEDGEPVYTYVCKLKERSQRSRCNQRNVSGNTLDLAIVEQIKQLAEDNSEFMKQLDRSKKFYTGSRDQYETQLSDLRGKQREVEKKITALVDSLVEMKGSAASAVRERIETLQSERESIAAQILEVEGLTEEQTLSDSEFDIMRQLLLAFRDAVDDMTLEQKRTAVRTLVRKVVWDGEYAHVVLFGAEDPFECPDLADRFAPEEKDNDLLKNEQNDDEMVESESCLGKILPPSAHKTRWGEDSIFDAAAGVGGQLHAPVGHIGVHALDQPDGADGNQIIGVVALGVVLFGDVGHQTEIVLDQRISGLGVALLPAAGGVVLFLEGEGLRKGASRRQPQHQQRAAHHQHQGSRQHL